MIIKVHAYIYMYAMRNKVWVTLVIAFGMQSLLGSPMGDIHFYNIVYTCDNIWIKYCNLKSDFCIVLPNLLFQDVFEMKFAHMPEEPPPPPPKKSTPKMKTGKNTCIYICCYWRCHTFFRVIRLLLQWEWC